MFHKEKISSIFSAYPDNFDFPNNRSILDMFLSKPIGLLALLDEESRFPQSTEFTLVNKWRENLNSSNFKTNTPTSSLSRKTMKQQKRMSLDLQPLFTISHYAGNIQYTAKDFLEKNRDYVPMEIINLLLQSDDDLVNLLFRSRLRKTGSVIYNEQEKQEKISTLSRSTPPKTTTMNRTQGTVSTYFRYSLMELVSTMASTQPTFIRCLVPNRLSFQTSHITYDHTSYFPQNFRFDSSQFDETVILEQIRYSGLIETIQIRRHGYSHRILFEDFISIYSCLIDLNLKTIDHSDHKQICELIFKKFHINNYAIGKTKVFLKFHHIEQLNIAHKNFLTKIIRLQSHIRMCLVKKQNQKLQINNGGTKYEKSVVHLQSMVRSFLARRTEKKVSLAVITIQSYWRMWQERTHYKHRLLNYRNEQIQISYFLKQIELYGNNLYQRLTNLKNSNEFTNQSSMSNDKNFPKEQSVSNAIIHSQSQDIVPMSSKQKFVILCGYYDKVYKEYLTKKSIKVTDETKKNTASNTSTRRPSTAPPVTNIPQAPPCPPPEFFQQTSTQINIFKRQISAPATVTTPIEELKQIFATRQSKERNSVLSPLRSSSMSPLSTISTTKDILSSSTLLAVNHSKHIVRQDDYQPRRRLSSTSSIIKSKSTGFVTCSTSSLVGDMALTPENVLKLKENLRKTGLVQSNQTLRRKLPTETIQIDFRSVLHSSKNNLS
ncbi:unnamed protein product [Rotaria sp. Silwood2]|nr:unnamed protein product [Rotaria sp. Silwood2]CAF3937976.1 unnamed protein product [Rotaria sp. Silwood2]